MRALRSGLVTLAILLGSRARRSPSRARIWPVRSRRPSRKRRSTPKPGRPAPPSRARMRRRASRTRSWVFENGRLVTPGAPADSQTVPAKFSERNNALDELPTMAFPLPLTDEQRQRIRAAVSKVPVESANARPAELLPSGVNVRELPDQITTGNSGDAQPRLCAHRRPHPADQPGEPHRRRRNPDQAREVARMTRTLRELGAFPLPRGEGWVRGFELRETPSAISQGARTAELTDDRTHFEGGAATCSAKKRSARAVASAFAFALAGFALPRAAGIVEAVHRAGIERDRRCRRRPCGCVRPARGNAGTTSPRRRCRETPAPAHTADSRRRSGRAARRPDRTPARR